MVDGQIEQPKAAGAVDYGPSSGLCLDELRAGNITRALEWNPGGKDMGGPFAACELAGEVGEAIEAMGAALGMAMATGAICNATKKAERARAGIAGGVDAAVDLGRELADVVICADLVAMRLGVNLGDAIVEKFNLTSRERGFATRISGDPLSCRMAAHRASASIYKQQRDALLEVLRVNDALAEVVAANKGDLTKLVAHPMFDRGERAGARCRELGIDTDRWCEREETREVHANVMSAGGAA